MTPCLVRSDKCHIIHNKPKRNNKKKQAVILFNFGVEKWLEHYQKYVVLCKSCLLRALRTKHGVVRTLPSIMSYYRRPRLYFLLLLKALFVICRNALEAGLKPWILGFKPHIFNNIIWAYLEVWDKPHRAYKTFQKLTDNAIDIDSYTGYSQTWLDAWRTQYTSGNKNQHVWIYTSELKKMRWEYSQILFYINKPELY